MRFSLKGNDMLFLVGEYDDGDASEDFITAVVLLLHHNNSNNNNFK